MHLRAIRKYNDTLIICPSLQNLTKHVKRVHTYVGKIRCNLCNREVYSSVLKDHMKFFHKRTKIEENFQIPNYKCDTCGTNFQTPSSLKIHIKSVHMGLKEHKCKYCNKDFSRSYNVKQHIRMVHEG